MIQDSAQPCGCDAGANWLCEIHRQSDLKAETLCFSCDQPITDIIVWLAGDDDRYPFHEICAQGALSEVGREHMVRKEKNLGYSARQNTIARQSAAGALHSRATIIGAMDHALETHASALRLLEAKIIALKERLDKMEAVLDGNAD